jgi:hypothetical protein
MQTKTEISFLPAMIQAIERGDKTQTRRVIKPQPIQLADGCWHYAGDVPSGYRNEPLMRHMLSVYSPYGQVGDVLSVIGSPDLKIRITHIRVERLRMISIFDVFAEGCILSLDNEDLEDFQNLWNSIYGNDPVKGWDANPWVWVYEFKRVEATP